MNIATTIVVICTVIGTWIAAARYLRPIIKQWRHELTDKVQDIVDERIAEVIQRQEEIEQTMTEHLKQQDSSIEEIRDTVEQILTETSSLSNGNGHS
jgi:predicted PurR-regulated permease PerM